MTSAHEREEDSQNMQGNGAAERPPAAEKEKVRQPKAIQISDIELESLKAELSECKDKYLRVLAESENARKRLQKEKQEMIQYATQNVIVDFLIPSTTWKTL